MKQDVGTVVAEAVKEEVASYSRLALKYIIFVLLFVFLIINMYMSQRIHPLYFSFITENMNSAVDLTKKVHSLPEGADIRAMQSEIYGQEFIDTLKSDETTIQEEIIMYEQALTRNPKARDILYNLYLLYKQKNDPKAQDYLMRARAVDPSIKD